jgi:hypothetical protein
VINGFPRKQKSQDELIAKIGGLLLETACTFFNSFEFATFELSISEFEFIWNIAARSLCLHIQAKYGKKGL